MDGAADQTEAFGFPSFEPLDRLIRQERAAANEAATASAEARMPTPQAKLLHRLGRRLRDYPALIVETGKIVRTGAAGGWLFEKWEGFFDAQVKAAIGYIQAVGDELVTKGGAMQPPLNTNVPNPEPPPTDDPEVTDKIRKAAEVEARANILAGKATPAETAKLIRCLDISGNFRDEQEIPDSTLLAAFLNLHELNAKYTTLVFIAPLANLVKLQMLDLDGTAVSDWGPVDHIDTVGGRPDSWQRREPYVGRLPPGMGCGLNWSRYY